MEAECIISIMGLCQVGDILQVHKVDGNVVLLEKTYEKGFSHPLSHFRILTIHETRLRKIKNLQL